MSDFIIDNVDIYDGSGGKPVMGSVAVSGDRITAVGQVSSTIPVETRIDGEGLALAPGIIDSHTHFDAQVTWDPMGIHSVWVNGTRIVNADGVVPIDNLPGRVLREF